MFSEWMKNDDNDAKDDLANKPESVRNDGQI